MRLKMTDNIKLQKICKFWNNDNDTYIGILQQVVGGKYPYHLFGGRDFKFCELLTEAEFKQIQCKMVEK